MNNCVARAKSSSYPSEAPAYIGSAMSPQAQEMASYRFKRDPWKRLGAAWGRACCEASDVAVGSQAEILRVSTASPLIPRKMG